MLSQYRSKSRVHIRGITPHEMYNTVDITERNPENRPRSVLSML